MRDVSCNACGEKNFSEVLDLGPIPIAHRFLPKDSREPEFKHPLTIHICNACALIQILDPIPPQKLYEDYNFCFTSWKPNPHIVDEIALISSIVGTKALVFEIGANDGGFLLDLKKQGFSRLAGVEPNRVSSRIAIDAGLNVYNSFFNEEVAGQVANTLGSVDLVVSRQVVEHIPDLRGLMANVRQILRPDGYVLFEVPDFEVPLSYGDCSSMWEEHVNYFTEPVMCNFLSTQGFAIEKVMRFPFSAGALMVLARKRPQGETGSLQDLSKIKKLASEYKGKVEQFRRGAVSVMDANAKAGKINVLYGAGCRSNALINGLHLGSYFKFIVDDQVEKQQYLMPGCRLEILPSQVLRDYEGACFLSVNHENEDKIIKKQDAAVTKKWEFYSLHAPSPLLQKIGVKAL